MKPAKKAKLPDTRNPRAESFLDMLHFSVAPLMKVRFPINTERNSFTWFMCCFDLVLYFGTLILQGPFTPSLRPTQSAQYYTGQLYPYYIQ
jgi:hypothetical protein